MFRADNLRQSESLKQMAEISGRFLDEILAFSGPINTTADDSEAARNLALATLQQSSIIGNIVPGSVFSPDGVNLTTVDAILDPVTLKGDRFTAYQFTPLNDTSTAFNLTGTGSRSNPAPSVFSPENIVLLTDGTCGSTCTLFSYLMILQLNIKTAAVGGRPQVGPMQSVAGVEGAQVFFLEQISAAAKAVITLDPSANVTDSELAILDEGYALRRAANPVRPGAVNGKNAFMRADAETPLQFLYQPANCRFFYTKDMLYAPAEVWKRAVDATWTDPQAFCVEDSIVEGDRSAGTTDERFFVNTRVDGETSAAGMRVGGSVRGVVGAAMGVVVALVLM